jgi:hypothetical protein
MRAIIAGMVMLGLSEAVAMAQSGTLESVTIPLTSGQTEPELKSLATTVRIAANIPKVAVDTSRNAITFAGTPAQLDLAGLLTAELDQPPSAPLPENTKARQYRAPEGGGELVWVLYTPYTATPQAHQEVLAVIRTVSDIRTAFPHWPRRAIALRSAPEQMDLAAWIVGELARPEPAGFRQYAVPGSSEFVVVCFPKDPHTPQQIQEKMNAVRVGASIPRAFARTSPAAIAYRGTAAEIEAARRVLEAMP